MQQPAYVITHIYLDKQLSHPQISKELSGNYLVFWWKEIALGHLFISLGEEFSEKEYYARLIEAIRPAVDLYASRASDESTNWQQLLLERDFEQWLSWMENIFTAWIPQAIPATKPVSVVICTRNRAKMLKQCIERLHQLSCLPEEIIVVDNAPSDDSTKLVAAKFENVTYIKEPRAGLDIARNTGLLHAQYDVVAFVDDDVLVHPMWIFWVWHSFQDLSVVAMTGLVIAAELQTEAQVNFEMFWSFNRGYADKIYAQEFFNSTLPIGPPVWKIGAGANMAFRKSVFEKTGLFNEFLDVGAAGCNGDSEMWYRILHAGLSIHYNPRAIVYHEHRKEHEGLKKQLYYYMRGFTVAALLQQRQQQKAGYKRHLFRVLPRYYIGLVKKGFPNYESRTSTIWAEMKGIVSGLIFYRKNQRQLLRSIKK